jgi:hypothetical protein
MGFKTIIHKSLARVEIRHQKPNPNPKPYSNFMKGLKNSALFKIQT